MEVSNVGSAVAKRRVAACHRDAMKIYEQAGTRNTVESNDSRNTTTFSTLPIIVLHALHLSKISNLVQARTINVDCWIIVACHLFSLLIVSHLNKLKIAFDIKPRREHILFFEINISTRF